MIINDLDGYYIVFDTKNWNTELDTLLNNTFVYKDFDLTIYAMGRFGQTIYSKMLGSYTAKSGIDTNQISGIDYWTEENQGAYYPRPPLSGRQHYGV